MIDTTTKYILQADNKEEWGTGWGGYYGGPHHKYPDIYVYTVRECATRYNSREEAEAAVAHITSTKFIIHEIKTYMKEVEV